MGSTAAIDRCRLCGQAPSREECFLAVDGEERPICRLCWEQALLDPRRAARRLHAPRPDSRFRVGPLYFSS